MDLSQYLGNSDTLYLPGAPFTLISVHEDTWNWTIIWYPWNINIKNKHMPGIVCTVLTFFSFFSVHQKITLLMKLSSAKAANLWGHTYLVWRIHSEKCHCELNQRMHCAVTAWLLWNCVLGIHSVHFSSSENPLKSFHASNKEPFQLPFIHTLPVLSPCREISDIFQSDP